MLGAIQAWAAGKIVQLVATGVVVAVLGGWLLKNNYTQRQIGAERVLAQSKKFGDAANAKSEDARAAAAKPGAAARMLKLNCRDCE